MPIQGGENGNSFYVKIKINNGATEGKITDQSITIDRITSYNVCYTKLLRHRLSEIFTIADSYTVFRDGGFIETGKLADIDRRHLVRQIVRNNFV